MLYKKLFALAEWQHMPVSALGDTANLGLFSVEAYQHMFRCGYDKLTWKAEKTWLILLEAEFQRRLFFVKDKA